MRRLGAPSDRMRLAGAPSDRMRRGGTTPQRTSLGADSRLKTMIGLIFKVLLMLSLLVAGGLVALNAAGVVSPGTIAIQKPAVEPCQRALQNEDAVYIHVRWIWSAEAYGWGCFYEQSNGRTRTLVPMPN
jgi:hypothetical protein